MKFVSRAMTSSAGCSPSARKNTERLSMLETGHRLTCATTQDDFLITTSLPDAPNSSCRDLMMIAYVVDFDRFAFGSTKSYSLHIRERAVYTPPSQDLSLSGRAIAGACNCVSFAGKHP